MLPQNGVGIKKEAAEVSALVLLLVVLSGLVFGGWPAVSAGNFPIAFICRPVVIWAAFRFTQRETATGIFILSAIAVWGTLHDFGPFVSETENESLLALQWWTAVWQLRRWRFPPVWANADALRKRFSNKR